MCTGYQGSSVLFNENGDQFSDLVTPIANGYLKEGAVQDTAYWSENQLARIYKDEQVVLALARPSISNTYTFKAGGEVKMEFALLQKDT